MNTKSEIESLPKKDEVLQNEDSMLSGLLEAACFKDDEDNQELIQIVRKKKKFFEFRIRPLEEEEIQECRKQATKYAPNPANRSIRMEVDVDFVRLRSLKIYTATTEDDRKKLWDKKEYQEKLNVLTGADMIDKVLMAGEKDWVCDEIDAISGYNTSLEEVAKN